MCAVVGEQAGGRAGRRAGSERELEQKNGESTSKRRGEKSGQLQTSGPHLEGEQDGNIEEWNAP
jgi:hypothetical protein